MIAFTVYGEAKPGGSKRAFRNPHTGKIAMVDASGKAGKDWRRAVAEAGAEAMGNRELLREALVVSMIFYRPRPKAHLRVNGEVRDAAPRDPITRPDLLKLARSVEDAMSGVVYHDDSAIVSEHLYKCYGEPARVYVSIDRASDEDIVLGKPLREAA